MPSFLVEAVLRILDLEVEAVGPGTTTLEIAEGEQRDEGGQYDGCRPVLHSDPEQRVPPCEQHARIRGGVDEFARRRDAEASTDHLVQSGGGEKAKVEGEKRKFEVSKRLQR
ncbi:hypothetical protein ACLBXJ_13015 [Methylobacterium mesophilicum]